MLQVQAGGHAACIYHVTGMQSAAPDAAAQDRAAHKLQPCAPLPPAVTVYGRKHQWPEGKTDGWQGWNAVHW
jgi:hypothetical protein